MTTADQKKGKYPEEPMRIQLRINKLPKARENAGNQVVVGFSFAADWLREWREFSGPITKRSKARLMQPM